MNTPIPQDHGREGINLDKILQCFRLLLPKNTRTLIRLKRFADLDLNKIKAEKGVDIKGLILDVDGCMAFNHQEILPENIEHIRKMLAKGIEIVVYSNMKWSDRYNSLPEEIKILTNIPAKPSIAGFNQACKILDIPKKNIAMVGDNYITDGGAIRAGIHFIYIEPLKSKNRSFIEFIRDLITSFFLGTSKFHDLLRF